MKKLSENGNRNRADYPGRRLNSSNSRNNQRVNTGKSNTGRSYPQDIYITNGNANQRRVTREPQIDNRPKTRKKKKSTGKKFAIAAAILLLLLIIGGVCFVYWYAYDLTGDINFEEDPEVVNESNDFGVYEENLSFESMYDVTGISSYQGYVLEWSTNGGDIIKSKNVTNVLLIGEDGDATEDQTGRSDCIMLVSIDRKNQKIVMTSFMRDSYCCYNTDEGLKFGKINGACFYSGYKGLIKTIENFYKIDINYYISVNFDSFPQLINALGGVTVPIQEYEARYIRNTTVHKTVQSGDAVKLDGWEALVFCRIRHCDADSDVSRTRRQRTVIEAIMQSTKSATKGQLLNAIKQVSPYIKTNMPQKVMISFATAALTNNWISYPMEQYTFPDENTRIDASIQGESSWAIDYPLAAQTVQQNIYGISNIVLATNRISLADIQYYANNTYEYFG